ncbi:MAG: cytochrome P460 family protein [Alphaproteobacteria bacterium]|nr:cytochrome P460 family protein [Alphaproteobacteria bacterium]
MFRKIMMGLAVVVLTGAGVVWVGAVSAQPAKTVFFGGDEDVAFAQRLWREMAAARLVGATAVTSRPYEGVEPHGAILVTLQGDLTVGGHTGAVIVKNNYMGESVSVSSVADNPDLNLAAVTVMFQRAEGYDSDNLDWFWAKYSADGSLQTNPQGLQLAGRIGKNPQDACIACHKFAPGDDYVFLNDQLAR